MGLEAPLPWPFAHFSACGFLNAGARVGLVLGLGKKRLCRRYRKLARMGKSPAVVTTAIARELAGFVWAIAKHAQPQRLMR
jgi:hypothetical protein